MPELEDARAVIETWELAGEGTVWVWQYDQRERRYTKIRVGGPQGSRKLRITVDDRRYNQEQVIDEMKEHDPFTNGSLRLTGKIVADDVDTRYHLTYEDLVEMLQIRDDDAFKEAVESIGSELIVRRLKSVAEQEGTVGQLDAINGVIDERYRVGGTQRVVQEMLDEEAKSAGTRLMG